MLPRYGCAGFASCVEPFPLNRYHAMAAIARLLLDRRMLLWSGLLSLVPLLAILEPVNGRTGETPRQMYREGQLIRGLQGTFHRQGDRVVFHASDGRRLVVLENLALERVDRTLNQSLGNPVWTVTGTATEFGGHNYLLLQTAFLAHRQ